MTEPPTPPRQESPGQGEGLPAPPVASLGPEQVVLNSQAEPSDDTPTIITRTPHRAGRSEDGFASTLRGRTLAHYELLEPVGVGGMAAVIRARDTQLDRIVALKILPLEMASDPETVRRFQHEARAAARLDHENIARVFFCGEDRGLNFISFEFVEGENLRTILDRRGRLPVAEAIHYVVQVALGLAHAASRGVVHRDIKPSNIIITPTGRAKLVDMGLARHLEPQTDHALTQSGVTLGTFDYISPEQALEPRDADVRSDIYSLGCTFYHLVTGQTPVPDGTAARKLHHHQHVAPVDPRQLNPEIPDEVAAILARMMAKNPAARYQRPELVIQHLVHVARQLGSAPEIPEEVLVVREGPLPAPPRLRPLLMAGAAATILIALVAVETMTPEPTPPVTPRSATASSQRPPDTGPAPVERVTANAPNTRPAVERRTRPGSPQPIRVHTARELADALTRQPEARKLEIVVANDIHIRADDGGGDVPGLVLHREKGHELILRSESDDSPHTIHWAYDASKAARTWAALTVEGGKVTIEGLRFHIDAKEGPKIRMMAIRLQTGQLDLKNCAFVQLGPAVSLARPYELATSDGGWLASVAVEADTEQRPVLHCTGCCFLSQDRLSSGLTRQASQVAVRVSGSAEATFDNCGLGPHATLFHLADKTDQATLTLRHCSALLSTGVAFQIDDGSNCPLNLFHCLFAHPPAKSETSMEGQAVLVRTTRRGRGNLYAGKDNRFYNLTAFCQQMADDGPAMPVTSWDDFKDRFARDGDTDSNVLNSAPWGSSDPLQELQNGLMAQAFRLDPQRPELRETGNKANRVIGVEECLLVRLYGQLPPLPERRPETHTVRTVNPNANDSAKGIYKTLNAAILDAQPGDEIQIRSDGPMKVDPISLQRASCDLTIRPSRNCHPILLLGDTPADGPASLFRLYDGKLRLIGLEFRLKPELKYVAPAIVTIAGSGQCTFRHCVVTLDAANGADSDNARLAAVVLADPRPAVKMDGSTLPTANSTGPPVVEWDDCFVRGTGDLIAMRSSRPVTLNGSNSLLALDGSLLTVRPYDNSKDMLPAAPMQLTLRKISAYLYDSLIRMRTNNDGKDLLPVAVSATECILTAAADGKAVVHFDGDMSDEKKMQDRVTWDGSNNVCSRFEKMFDQQVSDASPMMNLPPVGMKKWMDDNRDHNLWVYRDADRVIGPRNDDDPLTILRPREFRVRKSDVPRTCGADLGAVAQPTTETRGDVGTATSSE